MSTAILERPSGTVLTGGTPVLLRACADCEKEHGLLDRSDARKSHGHCRRHWLKLVRQTGCSGAEIEETLSQMGPEAFCEDLGA